MFVPDRNSTDIYEIDISGTKIKSEDDESFKIYLIKNIAIIGKLTRDELAESLLEPINGQFKSGMSYETLYTMLQNNCCVAESLCKEILELIIIKLKWYTTKDKIYSNADEIAKLILMPINNQIKSGMKKETLRKIIIREYGVAEDQSKEITESLIKKLKVYTTGDKIYSNADEIAKSILKPIKNQVNSGMKKEALRKMIIKEYGVAEHQSKEVMELIRSELNLYITEDEIIYTDRPA